MLSCFAGQAELLALRAKAAAAQKDASDASSVSGESLSSAFVPVVNGKIVKPPGEPGRATKGGRVGFNLQEASMLSKEHYSLVYVRVQ